MPKALTFSNSHIKPGDRFEITDCGDRPLVEGIVQGVLYRPEDWTVFGIVDERGLCVCEFSADLDVEICEVFCSDDGTHCVESVRINYGDNRCLVVGRPAFSS